MHINTKSILTHDLTWLAQRTQVDINWTDHLRITIPVHQAMPCVVYQYPSYIDSKLMCALLEAFDNRDTLLVISSEGRLI